MAKIKSLEEAFIDEIKDIYNSEKQILKILPKMAKKAVNPKLKEGFQLHLQQSKVQVERLDSIAELLGKKLTGKVCKATKGLVEEGSDVLEEESDIEAIIDSLLIGAARRVEHYEIAAYSSAIAMGQVLGLTKVVKLLNETLAEETKTDSALADLANKTVLPEANSQTEE